MDSFSEPCMLHQFHFKLFLVNRFIVYVDHDLIEFFYFSFVTSGRNVSFFESLAFLSNVLQRLRNIVM